VSIVSTIVFTELCSRYSIIEALWLNMHRGGEYMKLRNTNVNPSSSSNSKPRYSILDPNPSLIDDDGNLINDINKAVEIKTYRNGTLADGVSKLILVVDSNKELQFSINETKPEDQINGRLSCLNQTNVDNLYAAVKVSPEDIGNVRSVVVAVYTPPDSFNQDKVSNKIIHVNVSDPYNPDARILYELPIKLYRPPVVLVHGIWTNSCNTWIETNFANKLTEKGFMYAFADYGDHNSETFDPCAVKIMGGKPFGNHGIDSIRNAIKYILSVYHYFSIAASQVDIVAHSMGGLMARGFVQQSDYKRKENYMKGSIHRLITIGTPHLGGPLSKFLYDHHDDRYCFDENGEILPAGKCYAPIQLESSYESRNIPINQGGVKSLIPGSDAYSHLRQTNVKSYAIAGTWKPKAGLSHEHQESYYGTIANKDDFNLEQDGFDGEPENDLMVSVKSQLGGLPHQIRQPGKNGIPNNGALYPNTIHASFLKRDDRDDVSSEIRSDCIQEDVIKLLGSSDDSKFADAIGIDSPYSPSKCK
jgi:pimeloyl-ACP methyl ester carboxylesterase